MQGKTLTDVFIEKGLIKPVKCPKRLDGDESPARYILDGEEEPQNEKKSQA